MIELLWSFRIVNGLFFAPLEINQPSSKRIIGTLLVYKHVVPNGTKSRLRDSPNRPRDNFIVFQLRFFLPAGDQNLRARMIKRHQHASVPPMNLSRVFLQIQFMIMNLFQRIKRHPTQGDDYLWINQRDRAMQEVRAVANFARAWPAAGRHRRAH